MLRVDEKRALIDADSEIKLLRETIVELRSEMERMKNSDQDRLHVADIKHRDEVTHLKETVVKLRGLLEEKMAGNE